MTSFEFKLMINLTEKQPGHGHPKQHPSKTTPNDLKGFRLQRQSLVYPVVLRKKIVASTVLVVSTKSGKKLGRLVRCALENC